ncbi:hypothetical protein IPF86_02980 [Candidatus Nomurabacteria bacterium]|nr:MAG: hypothetical protein IPF86_02980 [Candidatus Nomurabacteria bacterium]
MKNVLISENGLLVAIIINNIQSNFYESRLGAIRFICGKFGNHSIDKDTFLELLTSVIEMQNDVPDLKSEILNHSVEKEVELEVSRARIVRQLNTPFDPEGILKSKKLLGV